MKHVRHVLPLACAALFAGCASKAPAKTLEPPVTPATANACEVWAAEQAFAAALEARDVPLFQSFLDKDAVFAASQSGPLVGAAAVMFEWKALVTGDAVRLHWYPRSVVINADGALAYSTGPVLVELPGEPEAQRFRIGRYMSTWVKREAGWRVLFDDGIRPVPATPAQVLAFFEEEARPCETDSPRAATAASTLMR